MQVLFDALSFVPQNFTVLLTLYKIKPSRSVSSSVIASLSWLQGVPGVPPGFSPSPFPPCFSIFQHTGKTPNHAHSFSCWYSGHHHRRSDSLYCLRTYSSSFWQCWQLINLSSQPSPRYFSQPKTAILPKVKQFAPWPVMREGRSPEPLLCNPSFRAPTVVSGNLFWVYTAHMSSPHPTPVASSHIGVDLRTLLIKFLHMNFHVTVYFWRSCKN